MAVTDGVIRDKNVKWLIEKMHDYVHHVAVSKDANYSVQMNLATGSGYQAAQIKLLVNHLHFYLSLFANHKTIWVLLVFWKDLALFKNVQIQVL